MANNSESSQAKTSTAPVKGRRLQRIADGLDRDAVLEFSALTLVNVHDLRATANMLLEKELYGYARSMGIMALEELGKFIQATSYLAGDLDVSKFVNASRNHIPKQRLGYLIAFMAPIMARLEKPPLPGPDEVTGGSPMAQVIDRMAGNIDGLGAAMEQQLPALQQLVKSIENGEIEHQRQEGFYVSFAIDELERISIKHPRLVSREEAVFVIQVLSVLDESALPMELEPVITSYLGDMDASQDDMLRAIKKMIDDLVREIAASTNASLGTGVLPEPAEGAQP